MHTVSDESNDDYIVSDESNDDYLDRHTTSESVFCFSNFTSPHITCLVQVSDKQETGAETLEATSKPTRRS